jgi:hypothetical protein
VEPPANLEELVEGLISIGFERDAALKALEDHRYNFERAAGSLADSAEKAPVMAKPEPPPSLTTGGHMSTTW